MSNCVEYHIRARYLESQCRHRRYPLMGLIDVLGGREHVLKAVADLLLKGKVIVQAVLYTEDRHAMWHGLLYGLNDKLIDAKCRAYGLSRDEVYVEIHVETAQTWEDEMQAAAHLP